jgi:hypothetical protein
LTVADSGTKSQTIPIWGEKIPTGETEPHPKQEIRRLLGTSQQELIKGAGSAYISAAEAITSAVAGIEGNAGKILTIWKGPDADKARIALELVHATGQQLARTLTSMGRSLETYAGYIPTAIAEVDGIKAAKNEVDAEVQEVIRLRKIMLTLDLLGDPETIATARIENARAQEALKRLNEKIRSLLISEVPISITYELPIVTIPPTPGASISVEYRSRTETQGSTFSTTSAGHADTDDASVSDTGRGNTGSTAGAPNPIENHDRSGGEEGVDPVTATDDQPGQDQPGGQDRPDGQDQPSSGQQPGNTVQPQEQTGSPGKNAGANTEDGTAPPVIGAQDRTAFDDAVPAADPHRTEASAYQPTTATIGNTPLGTVTPTATPAPWAAPPGVPSVIGSPNVAYTPGAGLAAVRSGSTVSASGTPFMPMTGAGGAMGDEGGDMERNTYLSEDRSSWSSSHDVTDPVIG